MKTHTIKTDTAELLIVELPRLCDYHASSRKLWVKDTQSGEELTVKGSWELLGKPDEIAENEKWDVYKPYKGSMEKETAKESLLSLIESEIYWENPISQKVGFIGNISETDKELFLQKQKCRFNEAEQKTFDRNRTLIFIKN